jgi:SAM-dependent methyltransferase
LQSPYRKVLGRLLGLEPWHCGSPDRHPYREAVVESVNSLKPRSVLEIGCGLGDVIARLHAPRRVGADVSRRVLVGALMAHPWEALLRGLSLRRLGLSSRMEEVFDVVICVNFIHNIDPPVLREVFSRICTANLNPSGVLVFDTVSNPSYRFNHDPAYLLQDVAVDVKTVSGFEFGRAIHIATLIGSARST